ncbi:MAG: ornithine carbamoyltransferase [candidate division WOR-3 bacterium]|nr:ornithine carbamoyltransferase [candidate division WOR-3 bacterium]
MKRDLTSIFDLTKDEIYEIFELTKDLKEKQKKGIEHKLLKDKTLAMVFEKPSLRTRVTFETGMTQLGGHAIYLAPADIQMGKRESVKDVAKNLSRWVDIIMARVFSHSTIKELAENADVPVINGLCDLEHPCQILCDLFTIIEKKGTLEKVTIAFVGDGNNVCNSFIAASARLGFKLHVATPVDYQPNKEYMAQAKNLYWTDKPEAAIRDADVIYTDVWASMGQEAEAELRKRIFRPFQINSELLKNANKKDYVIMHCLPAHRGEEITDEVLDGPHSIVFDQAENRLHIQKGIMVFLCKNS